MLHPITLLENFRWPTQIPGEVLALTLLITFTMLSTLEFCVPRDKLPAQHLRLSYQTNISLFVVNSLILSLLSAMSLLTLAEQYSEHGLLTNRWLSPVWRGVLVFFMLDLTLYIWHKAAHSFDCLWLFHKVHHNDPYLNISTSFRIHIVELIITQALKALLIILLGIDVSVLMSSEAVMTLFIMFHHSNICFKGEKLLGYLFIVPSLHRTHHSKQRCEHDSNYGAVFSLWDRLFGTLKQCHVAQIGIQGSSPQDLVNLIAFGFTIPTPAIEIANLDAMIAEAAYYKAEKRGFYPGDDIRDWLEAKRDILALVCANKSLKHKVNHQRQWSYFKFIPTQIGVHNF